MANYPLDRYDFILDGKGYMLARGDAEQNGRSWQVETVGTSIAETTPTEMRYGNQPSTIEVPMVWRTTERGYGDALQRQEGRYHYAINMDARFPGQILPGPKTYSVSVNDATKPVSKFVEYLGNLYFICGQYMKQIEEDDTVTTEKDFGSGMAATDAIVYDNDILVAMGWYEEMWQWDMSDAWVWGVSRWGSIPDGGSGHEWLGAGGKDARWSQASNVNVKKFGIHNEMLYASTSWNQVQAAAADPTDEENWSAAYEIGHGSMEITALQEIGSLLYIGKMDGLYALGHDGRADMLTPELRITPSPDNCTNMFGWHGTLWVPHVRGLLNYQHAGAEGFIVRSVTPGKDGVADNPIRGTITALVGDDEWLYATLYTASGDTYLLAGKEGEPMIWHPLAEIPDERCYSLHICSLWENPRLYMGFAKRVRYIILPRHGGNPLLDNNCRFASSGSIVFPKHSWGTPTTTKVFKQLEVLGERLRSGREIIPSYRIDGESWHDLPLVTLPPRHTVSFGPEGKPGQAIEVKLSYTNDEDEQRFIIRNIIVRGVERPSTVDVVTALVRCANKLPDRKRGFLERTGAELMTDLKALAVNDRPVELVDRLGYSRKVLVLAPIEEIETEQEGGSPPEKLLRVRMVGYEPEETTDTRQFWVWGHSVWGGGDIWR